jgi:hypothetical protein
VASVNELYIYGLLVGGGTVTPTSFEVRIPLRKWGLTTRRNQQFVLDLTNDVLPSFHSALGVNCRYSLQANGDLVIFPINPMTTTEAAFLKNKLQNLGLPYVGHLIETANLEKIASQISGSRIKSSSFLAGIFDAKASLELSQRRHSNASPVISIEIPGKGGNFNFVQQLCAWMTRMGSVTDQVLWNHPSMHSSLDPTYSGWKKGFKVRLLAKDFAAAHRFGMAVFSLELTNLVGTQKSAGQVECHARKPNLTQTSIHNDLDSSLLPKQVRNQVFLHSMQICAAMSCPFAPEKYLIREVAHKGKSLVSVSPLMVKGTIIEIGRHFIKELKLQNVKPIRLGDYKLKDALALIDEAKYSKLASACAYLFANSLNGKRPRGAQGPILAGNSEERVVVYESVEGGPFLIINPSNNRAALISSAGSTYSQELVDSAINVNGIHLEVVR